MIVILHVKCVSGKVSKISNRNRIILQVPRRTQTEKELESLKNCAFLIKDFNVKYSEYDRFDDILLWREMRKDTIILFDDTGLGYSFFSSEEFDKLFRL